MVNQTENTLLLIADISGYTDFMVKSHTEIAHSQVIITELIESILKEIKMPMKVSKLEGDAVFFYAKANSKLSDLIDKKLMLFFRAFYRKIELLSKTNVCNCGACNHIRSLRLKIVIHYGEVHFHKVGKFNELAGPSVITVHRLLKNSLGLDQYLMITEEAQEFLQFHCDLAIIEHRESYEGIGEVVAIVYDLIKEEFLDAVVESDYSKMSMVYHAMKKMYKSLLYKLGFRRSI